ncbi:DUF3987 domain-containing protein [Methylobacterium nigriterrae]|uniref:DUF3987 domain-containing protein n=1 Tax=Methylobacterium nigriterrae TaxID=3127512 RepID=UPI0030140BBD
MTERLEVMNVFDGVIGCAEARSQDHQATDCVGSEAAETITAGEWSHDQAALNYPAECGAACEPHRGPDQRRGRGRPGTETTWESPDLTLLGSGRRPAPRIPLEALGPWAEWITERAKASSAPVDYVAVALLACVGAAIANVRWPKAGAAWAEPPLLWCALVGAPSSSKSPAMDAVMALLSFAEERMALGFEDQQRAYATKLQASEARLEDWKVKLKAALKAGEAPPEMPADAQAPDAPERPRIRVADATVEKLGGLAAVLPRGLLLVRDELAGFFGGFGKYGGGGSERAFTIEMYGGRSYTVDRVKNPQPICIEHLSVGLLGGVQPDKLPLIIDGPDDGMSARVLWAWPEIKPEFSLARTLQDDSLAKANFARLVDLPPGRDETERLGPKEVRLTSEAEDALEAFGREVAQRADTVGDRLAGALGKARGHTLRLSAVLEYLWWCGGTRTSEPTCISVEAVEAAAGIVRGYFLPMAERVYGDADIPMQERRAMLLARSLRSKGEQVFNARDLRREVGGLLRQAANMREACSELADACLIRLTPSGKEPPRGRPALTYEVNPVLLAGQP